MFHYLIQTTIVNFIVVNVVDVWENIMHLCTKFSATIDTLSQHH